jgi:hypothetical protein
MCERLAAGNCSTGSSSKRLFERLLPACCTGNRGVATPASNVGAWNSPAAHPCMAHPEAVRRDRPSGTIIFLLTDAHGGVEVDNQGDAFFVAFPAAHRHVRLT